MFLVLIRTLEVPQQVASNEYLQQRIHILFVDKKALPRTVAKDLFSPHYASFVYQLQFCLLTDLQGACVDSTIPYLMITSGLMTRQPVRVICINTKYYHIYPKYLNTLTLVLLNIIRCHAHF